MIENVLEHPVDKIIYSHEQPQKYLLLQRMELCTCEAPLNPLFISRLRDRGGDRGEILPGQEERFRLGSNLEGRAHVLFIVLSSERSSMICKCLVKELIEGTKQRGVGLSKVTQALRPRTWSPHPCLPRAYSPLSSWGEGRE